VCRHAPSLECTDILHASNEYAKARHMSEWPWLSIRNGRKYFLSQTLSAVS
jgi:hypothetical protein